MRVAIFLLAALAVLAALPIARAAAAPKYYFNVKTVEAIPEVTPEARKVARALLDKELAGRPEVKSEAPAAGPEGLAQALAARKLQGYDVTLKIELLEEELLPPRPGGRLKQLAVGTKVTVFGTTIGEAKLSFSGEGESRIEAEIVDRRRAEEGAELQKEALGQAIKQAVDEAVQKLGRPKSEPMNEKKRGRKRK
jgi:hypothetical protein